jgi:hypothetical protein
MSARYCGLKCQRQAWKKHKPDCQQMQALLMPGLRDEHGKIGSVAEPEVSVDNEYDECDEGDEGFENGGTQAASQEEELEEVN